MLEDGATAEMIVVAVEAMLAQDASRRARDAERQRCHRKNVTSRDSPPCHATKERPPHPQKKTTPFDNPTGYLPPNDFDEFWAVYPRKIGKGGARKSHRNALKRATAVEILAGAKRYAATKPDPQFTKHASTWLNADCWLDEQNVVEFRNPPKRTWAEIQ